MTKSFKSSDAFRVSIDYQGSEKGLFETIRIGRETEILSANAEHIYPLTWVQYALSPLPGCCGVVVSHDSYLHTNYRGVGLGDFFHKERLQLMKDLGYSCSLATVQANNEAEKKILWNNGWKKVHEFTNSRTSNLIEIWVRDNKG